MVDFRGDDKLFWKYLGIIRVKGALSEWYGNHYYRRKFQSSSVYKEKRCSLTNLMPDTKESTGIPVDEEFKLQPEFFYFCFVFKSFDLGTTLLLWWQDYNVFN